MPINRQRHIALLAILLLSHAALTFHVSTHIPVDQTNCEYCAGHADPGHAVAHAIGELQMSNAVEFGSAGNSRAVQLATLLAYQGRAPPVSI